MVRRVSFVHHIWPSGSLFLSREEIVHLGSQVCHRNLENDGTL